MASGQLSCEPSTGFSITTAEVGKRYPQRLRCQRRGQGRLEEEDLITSALETVKLGEGDKGRKEEEGGSRSGRERSSAVGTKRRTKSAAQKAGRTVWYTVDGVG